VITFRENANRVDSNFDQDWIREANASNGRSLRLKLVLIQDQLQAMRTTVAN
jgi:hypothetical protein